MSRIELLLVQMDEAYQRLSRRLDGLTDEEYLRQQVAGWLVDPPRRRWHGGEIGTMRDLYRRRSLLEPRAVARP